MLGHTRWASVGIISEANAHPLNHEELDGDERPYVAAALNGDVDNFADLKAAEQLQMPAEITTDAKVIPTLVARAPGRRTRPVDGRVPRHGRRARGLGGHRGADRGRARRAAARACGAAARRSTSAWPRTPSSSPASPTAWSRRPHLPAHGRRDAGRPRQPGGQPRPGRGASTPTHAGTLDGIRRFAYDGTPLPVHADELAARRDHHPRHRPRRLPALPAQGDLRGAGVVPQDAAGQARRARRAPRRSRSGADTLPDDVRARLRDGSIRRVLVIGQGTAAVAGQSLAAVLARARRRPAPRRGRRSPPSSRASSCATTCPTRWSSPSASPAPPPTPTAPSTSPAPAAPRSSPSSTGATATSPTSPTACSTRPTAATWR